eukprot:629354-Rhodomonas_salina.2
MAPETHEDPPRGFQLQARATRFVTGTTGLEQGAKRTDVEGVLAGGPGLTKASVHTRPVSTGLSTARERQIADLNENCLSAVRGRVSANALFGRTSTAWNEQHMRQNWAVHRISRATRQTRHPDQTCLLRWNPALAVCGRRWLLGGSLVSMAAGTPRQSGVGPDPASARDIAADCGGGRSGEGYPRELGRRSVSEHPIGLMQDRSAADNMCLHRAVKV